MKVILITTALVVGNGGGASHDTTFHEFEDKETCRKAALAWMGDKKVVEPQRDKFISETSIPGNWSQGAVLHKEAACL